MGTSKTMKINYVIIFTLGQNGEIKVPLKAKIVQILFSQIHKKYAKYTFQTFTVGGTYRKYGLNKIVLHMHNFSEKPMKK